MEGVLSSRNYNVGDIIHSETAFVKVVKRAFKDIYCEYCCKTDCDLRACSECKAVKYCGKHCQKRDWSDHKFECKRLNRLPGGNSTDLTRLLGKVILKVKGKDWKSVKTRVLGKDFSFDDIDSHYKEMTENPQLVLFFHEMKELVGKYIGFENLPDDDSLVKIFGKVRFSVFRGRVMSFFIGINMFSFECIPNSNATVCGDELKIWAFEKIKKGKDKITVPGRTILSPALRFKENEMSSCKCADCSLPYGESILSKIIDKKKAFSVIYETKKLMDAAESFYDLLTLDEIQERVDQLLREHEGVLGDTNYIRMGLLALRSFNIPSSPFITKLLLLKLEKFMRSVFGEFYIEMYLIYKSLFVVNVQLDCLFEGLEYLAKVKFMEKFTIYRDNDEFTF